jgi:hypothetical protein
MPGLCRMIVAALSAFAGRGAKRIALAGAILAFGTTKSSAGETC